MKRFFIIILFTLLVFLPAKYESEQNYYSFDGNLSHDNALSRTAPANEVFTASLENEQFDESIYDFSEETTAVSVFDTTHAEEAFSKYEAFFENIEINAEYAFVYDEKNDVLEFKGNLNDKIYPASITKLWTAYVALEYLSPSDIITAGNELDFVAQDSSVAHIEKGNRILVETLIEGMLLPSGNDAAYIIARAAGEQILKNEGLSEEAYIDAFVDAMNVCGQKAGMVGTRFANPDGYHDKNHYTTMQDIILMSKQIMERELILKYTKIFQDKIYFESGEQREWFNTNLLTNSNSQYYINDIRGLKTGYTSKAGYCLLATTEKQDGYILTGIFRCKSHEERFEDAYKILTYEEEHYTEKSHCTTDAAAFFVISLFFCF